MEASNVFVRESKRLEYVIKGRGRGGSERSVIDVLYLKEKLRLVASSQRQKL